MDELVLKIIEIITNAGLDLSGVFELGQLPTGGGLRFQFAPSSTDRTWLTKGNQSTISLLGLSKNINQLTALQDLDKTSFYLESQTSYPELDNGIEIVDVMTSTRPQYVDKEDNGQYIYSMVLDVKISQ